MSADVAERGEELRVMRVAMLPAKLRPVVLVAADHLARRTFGAGCAVPSEFTHSWVVQAQDGQDESVWRVVACAGMHAKDGGFLGATAVAPQFRGLGLQRVLIRARLAYARRLSWGKVWTYTAADNVASQLNLVREGFRVCGFVRDTEATGGGWVHFERRQLRGRA